MKVTAALAALALAPAPSFVHFKSDYPSPLFSASPAGSVVVNGTADGSQQWLQTLFQSTLRLDFAQPQASVELLARTVDGSPALTATANTPAGAVTRTVADAATWQPVVLQAPGGAAAITSVDVSAPGHDVAIDELALSGVAQPDTAVTSGPAASTQDTTAAFGLAANRPDATAFVCSLDGGAFAPCGPFAGLALGAHALQVAAVDAYGAVDPTPASYGWTVVAPAPDTIASLSGAAVVFSSPGGAVGFECSVDGGPFAPCTSPFIVGGRHARRVQVRALGPQGQADPTPAEVTVPADADADGLVDANEKLPLGDQPPVVGVQAHAIAVSGDLSVQLPGHGAYVPFMGNATLPVGSQVDATKGVVTVEVASNGYAPSDRRYRNATVRLKDGIFAIRQARVRKGVTGLIQIPVEFVLLSPPGAERPCQASARTKGVVRTLTASGKGVFRVAGAASTAQGHNAAWTTTDRCDGTLTRVRRGHVRVHRRVRPRRTITVRHDHHYFVKARLFAAHKGR